MPQDGRREDTLAEPICVQYMFSRTIPTGQGIATHIRLLTTSKDLLVTVHGSRDVLLWSLALNTPPQRAEIDLPIDRITGIAVSPSSNKLIALTYVRAAKNDDSSAPPHEVCIYDWTTQTAEARLATGADFHSIQFSPDGRLLAWISAGVVDVWETLINTHVTTLREPRKRTNNLPVSKFAFDPDSSRLATADRAGRLAAWDVATWQAPRDSVAKTSWEGAAGREAVQLVASGRRVVAACRQTDAGCAPWTWRLTTWWPENGSRAELEMNGCAFACVPRTGGFVATVQADGGRLRIRDAGNGFCVDQSTQGIAKTGKTPSVVAGAIAAGDSLMVTQIANGRTTVWKLTAAV